MTIKTEGVHNAEFLLSEANGDRSRKEVIVISGQNLAAGAVVKASTTKVTAYANTGTATGILLHAVDASAGDTAGVVIARHAEIDSSLCAQWDAAAATALEVVGIFDRA
jgi:predicted metal-dependent enzyme (double-stranded beta helix superfamily)